MTVTKFKNERTVALLAGQLACMGCGLPVEVTPAQEKAAPTFHNDDPAAGRVTASFVGGTWTAEGTRGGTRVDSGPIVRFPWRRARPDPESLTATQRVHDQMQAAHMPAETTFVELVRCGSCLRRVQQATDLLAGLPDVARAAGNVGVERLSTCLDGLAALGRRGPTPAMVAPLLANMTIPATRASWRSRLSPILTAGPTPELAVSEAWAFLSPEDLAELRAAYGLVLREVVASGQPPTGIPAPGRGILAGCSFCGVHAVKVPALSVLRAGGVDAVGRFEWAVREVPDVRAFGGRAFASDRHATVALCRPCSAAVTAVGAVGVSAVEHAFLTASGELGELTRDHGPVEGLVGWAGLWVETNEAGKGTLRPNLTPWGHVTRVRS